MCTDPKEVLEDNTSWRHGFHVYFWYIIVIIWIIQLILGEIFELFTVWFFSVKFPSHSTYRLMKHGYFQTKRLIILPHFPPLPHTWRKIKKRKEDKRMEKKVLTRFFSSFIFFLSLFFKLAHKAKWSMWWTCSHFLTFSEWLHTFMSICWWS